MTRRLAALALLILTASPPLAAWWEAGMVRHMLGQIPLLVLAGVLLAPLRPAATATGRGEGYLQSQSAGIAAVLITGFCVTFWMLPRWFDAAASQLNVDAVKIVSLVLLGGLPLGWGWPRLGAVARGFVWAQVVGMFAVAAMLYLTYPTRLCNNYLVDEQEQLGKVLLAVVAGLFAYGAARAFLGPRDADCPQRGQT